MTPALTPARHMHQHQQDTCTSTTRAPARHIHQHQQDTCTSTNTTRTPTPAQHVHQHQHDTCTNTSTTRALAQERSFSSAEESADADYAGVVMRRCSRQ
ncbi:uncharacterized [Tachysurus ichikawai]